MTKTLKIFSLAVALFVAIAACQSGAPDDGEEFEPIDSVDEGASVGTLLAPTSDVEKTTTSLPFLAACCGFTVRRVFVKNVAMPQYSFCL